MPVQLLRFLPFNCCSIPKQNRALPDFGKALFFKDSYSDSQNNVLKSTTTRERVA
jgi:hypothetical protein